MKKKTAYLLGILLTLSMLTGCGSSESNLQDKEISGVSNPTSGTENQTSDAESTENSSSNEGKNQSTKVTIEEQVLYDENDIKITATGMEDSLFGTDLKLLIENNSGKSITVQARNSNVNGYMVDTMMSADVASGKKANDSLTFQTSGLKESGIEQIAEMEFSFYIFDSDTWDTILETDLITVRTSIADGYVQNYDDSGNLLVDAEGVKIIGKGLSANDSFWGPGLILYIENNSDKNVTIQVRDVSINGFMVSSSMSEDVVVGKKAISAVQFFSTDLESNGIDDITEVELYFHIFEVETWDTIVDTDAITINFSTP